MSRLPTVVASSGFWFSRPHDKSAVSPRPVVYVLLYYKEQTIYKIQGIESYFIDIMTIFSTQA